MTSQDCLRYCIRLKWEASRVDLFENIINLVVIHRCAAASEVKPPAFVAPTPVPAFVEPLPVPEEALPNELSSILDEW